MKVVPDTRRGDRTRSHQLLRTKLMPPRLPAAPVPRPGLLARLDDSLAKQLTMICAATGYGKSTLCAQWLAIRPEPSAWVSLDPGDDDPVRFWTYVITACQAFDPRLGKTGLAALRTSQQPPFEALIDGFINDLAALPGLSILVLEDYHVITSRQIHAGVAYLLDHLPDTIHLVLLARVEPPLPLARLAAHNQVSQLTAADLQFTGEETRAFLEQELRVPLRPETVARVDAWTEGWPAGLRLVTLAVEGKRDAAAIEQLLLSFSGGQRQVSEYLTAEVIAEQAAPVQAFLLQTSILDRLTQSLCDAVTDRHDSGALLTQLVRANLFLLPLGEDDGQQWYRYHALFAEALRTAARERFGDDVLREIFARASAWYEAHGFPDQAIETALAAGEYGRAAALIERSLDWRSRRELGTFLRWIEQIPQELLAGRPALCFEYAIALLFTSDRYAAATAARLEMPLAVAEEAWRREQNDARIGQVLAVRSMAALWQGDFDRAFALAHDSLGLLGEHDVFWRGSDLIVAGIEELNAGRVETAENVLFEARALSGAAQSLQGQLAAASLLADAYVLQGEFDQASQLYHQVQAEAVGSDDMLDDQGFAALGLSVIAYERNELAAAEREAARALGLGRQRSNDYLAGRAALMLVRVLQARGAAPEAREQLAALVARTPQPGLVRELRVWQARLALAAGDAEAARHWIASIARQQGSAAAGAGMLPAMQEQHDLTLARLLIAEGNVSAALGILERWHADARQHRRTSSEVASLVLIALAHADQPDQALASKAFIRALSIAQAKGYQRSLLDEGEPLRRMLSDCRAQIEAASSRLRAYAHKLLAALGSDSSVREASPLVITPKSAVLFEPLSRHEQRVLRLLVAGLSNPEIARELVVSVNTIKTQLQSIYRKLDVSNRAEAVEMARELNLL